MGFKPSDLRLAPMTQLLERDSGRAFDVQQRQSEVDQFRAQLENAKGLSSTRPAGSTGDAAIFTEHVKAAHIIRKVLLRQIAITNYINPM